MRKTLDNIYCMFNEYKEEVNKNNDKKLSLVNEVNKTKGNLNNGQLSKLDQMKLQLKLNLEKEKLNQLQGKNIEFENKKLKKLKEDILDKITKYEATLFAVMIYGKCEYGVVINRIFKDKDWDTLYNFKKVEAENEDYRKTLEKIEPVENIVKSLNTSGGIGKIFGPFISTIENNIEKENKDNLKEVFTEMKKSFENLNKFKNMEILDGLEEIHYLLKQNFKNEMEILNSTQTDTEKQIAKDRVELLKNMANEMAIEIIREDMKKNNITLPEFVKGMRYFKNEDEEI